MRFVSLKWLHTCALGPGQPSPPAPQPRAPGQPSPRGSCARWVAGGWGAERSRLQGRSGVAGAGAQSTAVCRGTMSGEAASSALCGDVNGSCLYDLYKVLCDSTFFF